MKPQQARSRRTLEALILATDALMSEGIFHAATVREIVTRADLSVGAFYSRFASKEALFDHMAKRYREDTMLEIALFDEQVGRGKVDANEVVRTATHVMLKMYRAHSGFLRSLFVQTRLRLDPRYTHNSQMFNEEIYARFETAFLSALGRRRSTRRVAAIRLGFTAVAATLRELVLFGEADLSKGPERDDALIKELSRMFLAYVGTAS